MHDSTRGTLAGDALFAGTSIVGMAVAAAVSAGPASDSETLTFLGRFHPLAVHLPIGIVVLTAAFEGLSFWPSLRARIDAALGVVLRLALVTTVLALLMGSMLAKAGGYPPGLLAWHRALTLSMGGALAVSLVVWGLYVRGRLPRVAHQGALLLVMALLGVGAHFGGSLTHGKDYLLDYAPAFLRGAEPVSTSAPSAADVTRKARVWDDAVLPLLNDRCVSCHGPKSAKGRLRLDSLGALLAGGKSGPAAVPGDVAKSLLIQRIEAPPFDDAHMPPSDEPQLEPAEVELLALWIARGASATLNVDEVLVPEGASRLLRASVRTPAGAPLRTASAPTASAGPNDPSEPSASAAPATALPTGSAAPAPNHARSSAAHGDVFSILSAKCGSCHGPARQRGKLRTDSMAALLAGGKSGPAIVPGAPRAGSLLQRIGLPLEHDEHMPPSDEPQLDPAEVAALVGWVSRGAPAPASAPAAEPAAAVLEPAAAASAQSVAALQANDAEEPSEEEHATPATAEAAVFEDGAGPLLVKYCGGCHSELRPTAGLDVSRLGPLIAGGQIVAGHPEQSPLFERMSLPLEDPDHMPPRRSPQLTQEELGSVRRWIAMGALDRHEATAEPSTPALEASNEPTSDAERLGRLQPRGGCAGCAVGDADDDVTGRAALVLVAIAGAWLRRRSRHKAASQ